MVGLVVVLAAIVAFSTMQYSYFNGLEATAKTAMVSMKYTAYIKELQCDEEFSLGSELNRNYNSNSSQRQY
jgi:hypothetical protein